jgi:hypothetical protein
MLSQGRLINRARARNARSQQDSGVNESDGRQKEKTIMDGIELIPAYLDLGKKNPHHFTSGTFAHSRFF